MKKGIIQEYVDKLNYLKLKIKTDQKIEWLMVNRFANNYMHLLKGKPVCEFETKDGKISRLIVNNKEISLPGNGQNYKSLKGTANASSRGSHNSSKGRKKSEESSNKDNNQNKSGHSQLHQKKYAKAPYNYVPVNEKVIETNAPKDLDRYSGYSGYIELEIENLTPLYIRDTYTLEEEKKRNKSEENKSKEKEAKWENPGFFSPSGVKAIPGSSLRGMIRNLVEIVSFSRMEFVDDTALYYRTMADKCKSVKDNYLERMGKREKNQKDPEYRFSAGYLCKVGKTYYIRPARKDYDNKEYTRIAKNPDYHNFNHYWQQDGSCIVASGPAPKKKIQDWLIAPPEKNRDKDIKLSPKDLRDYKSDKLRKEECDLLRKLEAKERKPNSRRMVPCFYIKWKDNKGEDRVSFGHTAYFRLPYELSIRDHIPPCHNEDKWDYASSIFGNTKHGGRVFFEDAKMISGNGQYQETHPKVLANPKPTSFHLYLEQGNLCLNELKHWGSYPLEGRKEGLIRGHKLYWHRITPENDEYGWKATDTDYNKNPSLYTSFMPIKKGCRFKGRVRFENLTDVELGALMFVLKLPSDCVHKLGMGKPLGLGSVKISPRLVITDRNKGNSLKPGRYGKLFEDAEWYLPAEEARIDFKKIFAEAILREIDAPLSSDLWKNPRMQELRAMLHFNEQKMSDEKWLDATKYIEDPSKFKNRDILDSATGVLKSSGIQ